MPDDFADRLAAALASGPPQRYPLADNRAAAVLVPFIGGDHPRLIFTVRTEDLSSHRGQISFPGGAVDTTDESDAAGALREAHEEIGLDPAEVRLLGELDSVPTFVSGYVIAPFVGWLDRTPHLKPNPSEVAEILEIPVEALGDEIRLDPGFSHGGRTYPTEAWVWNERVIWGATARVVRVLLERLAAAGLAPRPSGDGRWPSMFGPRWKA